MLMILYLDQSHLRQMKKCTALPTNSYVIIYIYVLFENEEKGLLHGPALCVEVPLKYLNDSDC